MMKSHVLRVRLTGSNPNPLHLQTITSLGLSLRICTVGTRPELDRAREHLSSARHRAGTREVLRIRGAEEQPAPVHLHTVGLWESAASPELGQQPILQVDDCLPDLLIFGEEVIVVECDLQVLLQRQSAGQLEHPAGAQGRQQGACRLPDVVGHSGCSREGE